MRDKRFVAEHRGGPLSKAQHRLMARWAADCAEHVLSAVWNSASERRPHEAVRLARAWANGEISVGDARKAAVASHAAAREADDPAEIAAARAAGHAVATAHAADHCLGAAMYALRAAEQSGIDRAKERKWQDRKMPKEIGELILSARANRPILG